MSAAKEFPLPVRRFATRAEMGAAAAADVADFLRAKISIAGHGVRVIFAAADSQRDMLESLIADHRLDWGRITASIWTSTSGCRRILRSGLAIG